MYVNAYTHKCTAVIWRKVWEKLYLQNLSVRHTELLTIAPKLVSNMGKRRELGTRTIFSFSLLITMNMLGFTI